MILLGCAVGGFFSFAVGFGFFCTCGAFTGFAVLVFVENWKYIKWGCYHPVRICAIMTSQWIVAWKSANVDIERQSSETSRNIWNTHHQLLKSVILHVTWYEPSTITASITQDQHLRWNFMSFSWIFTIFCWRLMKVIFKLINKEEMKFIYSMILLLNFA